MGKLATGTVQSSRTGAALASAALLSCLAALVPIPALAATQGDVGYHSGVYLQNRDTGVRPQDDFFHYVNGHWIATNEIPADKSSYGNFHRLREEADADVLEIIEEAAAQGDKGDPASLLVGRLYSSFMDEKRVNSLGVSPLEKELAIIGDIASEEQLLAWFARAAHIGVKSPLSLSISEDFKDTSRYRAYLQQSGLGLPNSDYYSDDSDKGREIVAAYKEYATAIYRKLGYQQEAAEAATMNSWQIEARLASRHRPPVENREYARWYNLRGDGHDPLPPGVRWSAYLEPLGIGAEPVISLAQPEYIDGLAAAVSDIPLDKWRDYLKLRLGSSSAPYLDQEMQDLSFGFYSRTLAGVPEIKPRWKRGVSFVNGAAGEAVGRIYVQKHFPPEAKARMDELVANLIEAYRASIKTLDWMSEETRANALAKLEKFTPNIGFPDKWKDYSDMQVGDDLLPNVQAANRWELAQDLAKLGGPVDRGEWFMNPQDVNAYYYSLQNSITFPAAILQPPFFDPRADDAVNYGAIGSVIGHEIGHGFDDNGSQFDGDGRLDNWWNDADRAAYKSLTAQLVDQYDLFEVLPGVKVNGKFTQGENIGDLAGVSIAYQAYLRSLGGRPAPKMDGYTGEQRFFIGFAQAFLSKAREERKRQLVKIDTHSPPVFRVNGVMANVEGFYQAFDLKPGDALYRPPEKRVRIW